MIRLPLPWGLREGSGIYWYHLPLGLAFWAISNLMFQALMGLFLAIILMINMLGALFIVPSFIAV